MAIINEEKKYCELKESIRMMNCQRSCTKRTNLTAEGQKKKGVDEIIKRNEIVNNIFKSQI